MNVVSNRVFAWQVIKGEKYLRQLVKLAKSIQKVQPSHLITLLLITDYFSVLCSKNTSDL